MLVFKIQVQVLIAHIIARKDNDNEDDVLIFDDIDLKP